ncbi:MAG: TolC family protein [Prevotellaceae bacterium]|jgi:outer membrane protein TolC|nr:TolC family protein [Prevotellaceae bacterium]
MKRILISTAVLLLSFSFLKAQEVYDLKRCLEIGLEQNYSIRISSNNQQKAENNYTIGGAGYLPTLDLSGRYSGSVDNNKSETTAGVVTKSNGVHTQTLGTGLDLSWNLFNGFSVQTTYKKLKELKRLGELNTRITIEDIVAKITSQYYDLVQQNIRLRNLEYALSISKERVRIVQERYLLGSASKLELQQAQVNYNSDSSNYIAQTETLYKTGIELNELMAVENVAISPTIENREIHINTELDERELERQMLAVNASLLVAERNNAVSQLDHKLVKSRGYPYLRVSGSYGYSRTMYGSGTTDYSQSLGLDYGITLGFNIFNGFNQRRDLKNAKIDIKNRELERIGLEQSLKVDLATIYNGYRNNLILRKMEEDNLETAKDYLDIAMERYKLGALSGIELREAQKDLLDAQERLLNVSYKAKLAEISLMQISGRALEYLELNN